MKYTNFRAVFGSGSPYKDIIHNDRVIRANQTNNSYIFPGLALGAVLSRCRIITDEMVLTAAEALQECVTPHDLNEQGIFPKFGDIQEVSVHIAC